MLVLLFGNASILFDVPHHTECVHPHRRFTDSTNQLELVVAVNHQYFLLLTSLQRFSVGFESRLLEGPVYNFRHVTPEESFSGG